MGTVWAVTAIAAVAGVPVAQAAKAPLTAPTMATPKSGCRLVRPSRGSGYDLTIGLKQDGKAICAHVGEKVLVLLSAPTPTSTHWSIIEASPPGILVRAPMTIMLSKGVTAAIFKAVKTGTVELSSQRPACAPATPGHATCMAIELWKAGLVVRSNS
jgi:hypothetical protein